MENSIDFFNTYVCWMVIYPVDNIIQCLNNWGLNINNV